MRFFKEKGGFFICIAGAAAGATIPICLTLLKDAGINPYASAFYRLLFISIFLAIFSFKGFKHKIPMGKPTLSLFIYALSKALGLFFWALAIEQGSSAFLSSALGGSSTIFVMLLSLLFFREFPTAKGVLGILMSVAGIAVMSFSSPLDSQVFAGVFYLLAASLCSALNLIYAKILSKSLPFLTLICYGYTLSTAISLVLLLFKGESFHLPLDGLPIMIFLACFSTLISHSAPVLAVRRISPVKVSAISLLSPFIAALLGWMILGQPITFPVFLGAFITALGLFMYIKTKSPPSLKKV